MSSLCCRTSLLSLCLSSVVACSGGGNGGGGTDPVDGGPIADGGGAQVDAGGGQIACVTVDDFTDLGAIDGNVISNTQNAYLSIDNAIGNDLYVVELFGGYGVLTDGLAAGTYEITGAETDYDTCGVCVSVYGDFDPMAGSAMIYLAQSGTVTISSIAGNFTGSYVPAGGTTTMIAQVPNDATMMYDTRTDCTITGGGATWDKAIPVAPAP